MADTKSSQHKALNEESADRKRDSVLKRLLGTPPKPHVDAASKKRPNFGRTAKKPPEGGL
jgi:hypothetical protein